MKVYAYVFMPNHVHLVFRSNENDPSGLIRDLKGFTSRQLIKAIEEDPSLSWKVRVLKIFSEAAESYSGIKKYQLWQNHNHPILVYDDRITNQKVNYIDNNPVKKGWVADPADWKYSSARNYKGDQSVLEIDLLGSD